MEKRKKGKCYARFRREVRGEGNGKFSWPLSLTKIAKEREQWKDLSAAEVASQMEERPVGGGGGGCGGGGWGGGVWVCGGGGLVGGVCGWCEF